MKRGITQFQEAVWEFYNFRGRHDLPWRIAEANGIFDPYKILVSEIMLQQTQVPRVIPKYQAFLAKFPSTESLAEASLADVLIVWSGLGYNRRAKFLWQAAQKVVRDFGGLLPHSIAALETLPGVGPNTAGAVMAYAFNEPVVFIETNIRTAFIHTFFKDETDIPDSAILRLVRASLPQSDGDPPYRQWYWALMDYGAALKQTVGNLNHASKSYAKQPSFAGSRRQLRGQIIQSLLERPRQTTELEELCTDPRLSAVLEDLVREHMIQKTSDGYALFS